MINGKAMGYVSLWQLEKPYKKTVKINKSPRNKKENPLIIKRQFRVWLNKRREPGSEEIL
jgi:hypothetical protein